jgi:hypothetical protein
MTDSSLQSKKIVIYTVISGGYDVLREPEVVREGFDFVCFTDQVFPDSKVWDVRPLTKTLKSPVLTNRYHKMLPHILFPEYEYSVYIDGNIQIIGPHLYERVTELIQSGQYLSMVIHPFRQFVYDEAKECIACQKETPRRIRRHLAFLKARKYPRNNGLFEANVIFRQHSVSTVVQLMQQWWDLFVKYARRDQLSLPYVLWVNQVEPVPFYSQAGDNVRNHPGYAHFEHLIVPELKPVKKSNLRKVLKLMSCLVPVRSWRKKIRRLEIRN